MGPKQLSVEVASSADGPGLEGRLRGQGPRGAVIAAPHPLYGGSIDNPVVAALEAGLSGAGLTTLAFNWRGVGASEGSPSGELSDATADYIAAMKSLGQVCAAPHFAGGYSFGAATALALALAVPASHGIDKLILISPPLAMLGDLKLETLQTPLAVISGDSDVFAPVDTVRTRLGALPQARLEIVEGADHFFSTSDTGGLAQLAKTLAAHLLAA